MVPTPRTSARLLSLLEENPCRGMPLRQQLLKRYGMSDTTRAQSMRHLLSKGWIKRIPVGPGRSAEYRITDAGRDWLNDYLNSASPQLLENVSERLPLPFGCGSVEITYTSNLPYLSKRDRVFKIAQDRNLNRLIARLIWKELPTRDQVSFHMGVRIDTEIPPEVRYLWRIVHHSIRRRHRWFQERKRIFRRLYENKGPSEKDKTVLCLLDYFYYCPMGAIEYTIIDRTPRISAAHLDPLEPKFGHYTPIYPLNYEAGRFALERNVELTENRSELCSFALAKWPALSETLRTRIRDYWEKHFHLYEKSVKEGFTENPHVSSEFDCPYPRGKDEAQKQLFYVPDYRMYLHEFRRTTIHVGESLLTNDRVQEDFSDSPAVKMFNRALNAESTRKWFAHLYGATGSWVFRRDAANPVHVIGFLVSNDLFDEGTIEWLPKRKRDTLDSDVGGWDMDDVRLTLHQAVRHNCLMHLWHDLFDPLAHLQHPNVHVPDDETWFRIWERVRYEFLLPPQRELMRFFPLPMISELPTFFKVLDKLCISWINADRPRLKTRNIDALVTKAVNLLRSITKNAPFITCRKYHWVESQEEKQRRDRLMSVVCSHLVEFLNELEWEFPS